MRQLLARRAAARLVDTIVITVPIGIAWLVLIAPDSDAMSVGEAWGRVFYFFGFSIPWLVIGWPMYESIGFRRGGSVGKRLLRLKHVSMTGTAPTRRKATLRGFLLVLPPLLSQPIPHVGPYVLPILYAGSLACSASRDLLGRHWLDRVTDSVVLPRDAKVFDLAR
jgi:uncharacterized RDD family membrane protein YckC